MEEEKKRKGDSSNKSAKREKEVELNNKVEASNTVELDIIKENEVKSKNENEKVASVNEQKMNINPTTKKTIKEKAKRNRKIKLSKQMMGLIIIIISCIIITISLIVLKIRDIRLKYKTPEEDNVFVSENKKQDEELRFVVGENDTLDYNSIDTTEVYLIDGNEMPEGTKNYDLYSMNYSTCYNYLKISGLKDKNIENKINEKIKSYIMSIDARDTDGKIGVYSYVVGNYNNILSINIHYYNESNTYTNDALNLDLNTGNDFKLEDVFVKSTSIINVLYSGLCEKLAWDIDLSANNDDEYFKKYHELTNMDNRDTSYYEDMIFKLSTWYKNNKGNISFNVSPTKLYVYNVLIDGKKYDLQIPLSKFKESVAIYKRYSSTDSLFDNNKYGTGYIPFSMPMSDYSNCLLSNKIDYGKKSNNLFVDSCFQNYSVIAYNELNPNIYNSMKVFTNNLIIEVSKKANSNLQNGYILQSEIGIADWTGDTKYYIDEIGGYPIPHYRVMLHIYEVELPIDDYRKNLNNYLEEAALFPRSSVESISIRNYLLMKGKISGPYGESKIYYFDSNGNYLGDDISVIKDTTREVYNPS